MLEKRKKYHVLRMMWYAEVMEENRRTWDVGLQLKFRDNYDMAVAAGVVRYAKERGNWQLHGMGKWFMPLEMDTIQPLDGIIARIEGDDDVPAYQAMGLPVVDIAGACTHRLFSTVRNDDYATGVAAGNHLLTKGITSFASCEVDHVHWSRERLIGFCGAVGSSITQMQRFGRSLTWWQKLYEPSEELQQWLESLAHPTAVFCSNDMVAMKVEVEARRLGISIPDELCVLGVDDEALLCSLATPSLSSVHLNCERIGYEAAAMLDGLLGKHGTEVLVRRIAPGEVVERESTTVSTAGDALVAQALQFIRRNVRSGINVADVVVGVGVCRRSLEQRFFKECGMTLLQAIHKQRMVEAQMLLRTTDLPVEVVAQECGFMTVQRFYKQFGKQLGMTPGQWRRANRSFGR